MFKEKEIRGLPVRGIMTVLGSFLSLLVLGAFYTFGNISPYLISYMRNVTGEDITYRYAIFSETLLSLNEDKIRV